MQNYFENDYAAFRFKQGILHITYHQGLSIGLDAAVQVVKDRILLQEGRQFPILCDIRGVKEIDKSARSYLALEGSVQITAIAFIVDSPVSVMLTKFYLKTSKPPVPTRSFKNIEEALVYLNGFKDAV